jgi:hypothetical protein
MRPDPIGTFAGCLAILVVLLVLAGAAAALGHWIAEVVLGL